MLLFLRLIAAATRLEGLRRLNNLTLSTIPSGMSTSLVTISGYCHFDKSHPPTLLASDTASCPLPPTAVTALPPSSPAQLLDATLIRTDTWSWEVAEPTSSPAATYEVIRTELREQVAEEQVDVSCGGEDTGNPVDVLHAELTELSLAEIYGELLWENEVAKRVQSWLITAGAMVGKLGAFLRYVEGPTADRWFALCGFFYFMWVV
ncbi:hypothetical protein IAT38_002707 [Cryptococcus sp. DSM 104549]